jgi:hypothetical protein
MKEVSQRSILTTDGPFRAVDFTLLDAEPFFYVSLKIGEVVHVVDALHLIWTVEAIQGEYEAIKARKVQP